MLVSAAIAGGPPQRILDVVRERELQLLLPEPVLREFERVLVEKLGVPRASVEALVGLLVELATAVVPGVAPTAPLTGDLADDLIVSTAAAAGAEILVSGDHRHVLPVGRHGTMRIARPQDFLAELARS